MKTNLFNEVITDRRTWRLSRKSAEIFLPLAKYIYETNNIKFGGVSALTDGSSPVFRIGDTVLKIFCPSEFTLEDRTGYTAELEGLKFCKGLGVNTPDILYNGTICDSLYSFPYIVMTYIDGVDVDTAFLEYSLSEKVEHVKQLRKIYNAISVPTDIDIPRYDEPHRINHAKWNIMPESFREDRKRYIKNADFPEPVFNHGDFGGCNIIIDKQGRLNMIDFEGSLIAPYCYEMPLWDEPALNEAYYGDYKNDCFYDALLIDTLIYPGGADNIKNDAKVLGIDFSSITSVDALRSMLIVRVNRIG